MKICVAVSCSSSAHLFLCVFPLAAPFNSAVPMWETRDPAFFFCTPDPTGRWDEGAEGGEKEPTRPAPKNFFSRGSSSFSFPLQRRGLFFARTSPLSAGGLSGVSLKGSKRSFWNSVGYSLPPKKRHERIHFLTPPSLTSKVVTSEAAASTHSRSLPSPEKIVCFCFPFLWRRKISLLLARSGKIRNARPYSSQREKRISLCSGVSLAALSLQHLPKRPPLLIRDRVTLFPP